SAISGWSSVLILANVTSGCSADSASKTGAKDWHGPHQGAQKSTISGLSPSMASWNVSLLRSMVVMGGLVLMKTGGPVARRPFAELPVYPLFPRPLCPKTAWDYRA